MNLMNRDTGPIHFVGIGGIGMSGIAELLHALGYRVQGSDIAESANVRRLRDKGIAVGIGHDSANLDHATAIVVSSAIQPGNPEVEAARARRLPVVRRADMLAELMRLKNSVAVAGTHGKTTTTAMVAAMFDAAGLDPTVVNGGIINAYGTNARLGAGDWMIVEADESDGSFLRLPATIGIITNIDPEHMEFWKDFEALRGAFANFIERLPFYGFGVVCVDHAEVRALLARITDRRVITYGFSPQADIQARNATITREGTFFDIVVQNGRAGAATPGPGLPGLRLGLPGRHNIANALAAFAIGHELGFAADTMRAALEGLSGVKRRFTRTGDANGITVIDDYAHHPEEIRVVLETARATASGRVIAVMQPHRYSRLDDLFDGFCTCFGDADIVVVAPVYAAGEPPIEGRDHAALVAGLRAHGQRHVEAIESEEALAPLIARLAHAGDLVVCMGAGSITQWANALPARLQSSPGGPGSGT